MRKGSFQESRHAVRKRSYSLGWRIFFWMSLIAMVPLIIMAYQGYHCARQAVVESRESHLRSVLEARKMQFVAWLSEIGGDMKFLSETPCIKGDCSNMIKTTRGVLSDETCHLLEQTKNGRPYYKKIVMLDKGFRDNHRATGDETLPDQWLPEKFRVKLASSDGFVFSSVHKTGANAFVMYAGIPVLNEKQNKAGYIVATIDFDKKAQMIANNRLGLGKTGTCFLLKPEQSDIDMDGPVTNRNVYGKKILVSSSENNEPVAAEYKNLSGTDVIGMATALPDLNVVLVLEMDQGEVFSWLRTLRFRAVVTGTITLAMVIVIAMKRARKLSQPLKALADVAQKIAGGDHGERMKFQDGTEAREVASAFNKMMDELEASQRKLMHAASLAAVGELSSSIVHEMRNPLSSVKMNVQALRKKVADDPAYAELADIAGQQAERLETMLSDLLNYGKPIQLKVDAIHFDNIMGEVLALMRQDIEQKHISVDIHNDLGEQTFAADSEQLKRALTNIMDNAVKATMPGGTITVNSAWKNGRIIISVRDSGKGITETARENLFKPFFTTRDSGTGLGLANVKKIVEYHGGSVTVYNHENGGAVFIIELPAGGPTV